MKDFIHPEYFLFQPFGSVTALLDGKELFSIFHICSEEPRILLVILSSVTEFFHLVSLSFIPDLVLFQSNRLSVQL